MSRETNEGLYVPLKKKEPELTGYAKFADKHGAPPIKNLLLTAAATLGAAILILLILMVTGLRLSTVLRDDGTELKYFGWVNRGTPTLGIMQASDGSSAQVGGGDVVYSDGSVYSGDMKNFVPDGFGKIIYADGESYTGFFKNGLYHYTLDETGAKLSGKLIKRDGTTYEGEFENGLYHGNGKIIYPNGTSFSGSFENGQRKEGTELYYDGSKFVGSYENDMRSVGTYTWKARTYLDGYETVAGSESISGYFKNNVPDPSKYMMYTDADGDTFKVRIINGVIVVKLKYTPPAEDAGGAENDSAGGENIVG